MHKLRTETRNRSSHNPKSDEPLAFQAQGGECTCLSLRSHQPWGSLLYIGVYAKDEVATLFGGFITLSYLARKFAGLPQPVSLSPTATPLELVHVPA